MGRRVKSKSNLVIHEVEGTSLRLKVTSNLETKIKKGTASLNTLARKLAQENKLALQGLFKNPEKEFKRLAGFSTDSKNFLQRITTAYRSALYSVDKGRLLAENMKQIVAQSLDEDDLVTLKAETNMTNLNFDDWNWDEGAKVLKSPDGKYWIKVEGSAKEGDYESLNITWGGGDANV